MRQQLTSLLRRLIGGVRFRRRLPPEFGGGRIVVCANAALSWLRPNIWSREAGVLDFARVFVPKGGVAWDVGANVGLFSFAAAGVAGKNGFVAAFEPESSCISLLQRSRALDRDKRARVEVFPIAISNSRGISEFHVAGSSTSASHLQGAGDTTFAGRVTDKRMVVTAALDDFIDALPQPSAIKIDVEGHEVSVLEGARNLIARSRPTVLVEVVCGSHAFVAEYFGDLGYCLFEFSSGLKGCKRICAPIWNTLALPSERVAQFPCLGNFLGDAGPP